MGRKRDSLEPSVVLHSFYVQILSTNLISSLNWSLTKSTAFNLDWSELGLIRDE